MNTREKNSEAGLNKAIDGLNVQRAAILAKIAVYKMQMLQIESAVAHREREIERIDKQIADKQEKLYKVRLEKLEKQ